MPAFLSRLLRRIFGWAVPINPPVYACADEGQAIDAAAKTAAERPGRTLHEVAPTGSMVPLIPKARCYLVTEAIPFESIRLGMVATYSAAWHPGTPLVHRLVARDKLGYIASGDANKHTESFDRVTPANFMGEVVGIWTFPPKV